MKQLVESDIETSSDLVSVHTYQDSGQDQWVIHSEPGSMANSKN